MKFWILDLDTKTIKTYVQFEQCCNVKRNNDVHNNVDEASSNQFKSLYVTIKSTITMFLVLD